MVSSKFYSQYMNNTRGNTVMVFALLLIPLSAVVGFAVDFNRTTTARGHMQFALDASSLAAARGLEDASKSDAEIETIAVSLFKENMSSAAKDLVCLDPNVSINRTTAVVAVTSDCTLPTTLSAILSVDEVDIQETAAAQASLTRLDLALMLDVSGSMGGQKLIDLKTAAKDAAATLITDRTGDRVRIGFNTYANSINAGLFGPDVLDDFDTDDFGWFDEDGDGIFDPDEPPVACVSERTGIHAWKDSAPGFGRWLGNEATLCPKSSILPITHELDVFNEGIDTLKTGGMTAGHLGVAWSWYLISPEWASIWPSESTPLAYTDPHVVKSVILMTDGIFNKYYESAQGDSAAQAKKLCAAMRDAGVIVYSVAFQAPASAEATLRNCAGEDSRYFEADNGAELKNAYAAIASQLSSLAIVN